MVIPVPTLALAKVKNGEPPKITSSPDSTLRDKSSSDSTPPRVADPVAEATLVPSYTLLSPVRPEIVNSLAVMSPDKVG